MKLVADGQAGAGNSLLLVAPEYEGVTSAWFVPEFWGKQAVPVTSGGRGGAWFIDAEPPGMVLRHYRRGGLAARITEKTYLFTGFDRARSLAEFRLLVQLRALGLPVPEAVAAIACRHRMLWYQAAILVKRIPDAVTLPDNNQLYETTLWTELGRVIRRFHNNGLNHVDLNCDNILVADEEIYLIDFDRCRLMPDKDNAVDSSWKRGNLERLQRSVTKRCADLPAHLRDNLWQALLQGYQHSPLPD